jgi:hypothetical protein
MTFGARNIDRAPDVFTVKSMDWLDKIMRTNEEIIASLKKALLKGIESASHLERYKLEYIDVNISVCPGEPPLFEGKGCNAAELWQLIGDFERLSNVCDEGRETPPCSSQPQLNFLPGFPVPLDCLVRLIFFFDGITG